MTNYNGQSILEPSKIVVTEQYAYISHITGIERIHLDQKPKGIISACIPYERREHYKQLKKIIETTEYPSDKWLEGGFGGLSISHFGYSNLQRKPEQFWDDCILPLRLTNNAATLRHYLNNSTNFDINFRYPYQPDKPNLDPLRIRLEIKDEDEFKFKKETLDAPQSERINDQAGLKRSLILLFNIELILPDFLSPCDADTLPFVKQMTLSWPLSTPYQLASLSTSSHDKAYDLFNNPEKGSKIQWYNIPFEKGISENQSCIFRLDTLHLEINDPAEFFQLEKLSGSVEVEIDNLFSGLQMAYTPRKDFKTEQIVEYRSTLINEFTLNLTEGIKGKLFSPSQLLQFPGVGLEPMRLTDIKMLLEDKGFETEISTTPESIVQIIKAKRTEGKRDFEISLVIRGEKSQTSRERAIIGDQKYTTNLETGNMSIEIEGTLSGDRKRVVSLVNEIQEQLKEHFRHVIRPE